MNNLVLNIETALAHSSKPRNTKCNEMLLNWTIFSVIIKKTTENLWNNQNIINENENTKFLHIWQTKV